MRREILPRIDVVIPLSNKSRWQDNELRFALRALETNLADLGRVFIVGHNPPWLQNVIHIPAEDGYRHNKDANLIAKVLLACQNGVSERFVRQSDDQCLLRPSHGADLVPRHHGELKPYAGRHGWYKRMERTRAALLAAGKTTLYFDTHVPTLYDRQAFLRSAASFSYGEGRGFCINTLYANSEGAAATGSRPLDGQRLAIRYRKATADEICTAAQKCLFLGYDDGCLGPSLKTALLRLFPAPSRFESDGGWPSAATATVIAVVGMSRSGTSCVAGMLDALGVSMGGDVRRADRHNPKGYFEDREIGRICRRKRADKVQALSAWLAGRQGAELVGVKNGRLGGIVPDCVAAWPRVKFVVTERPVDEIVASWSGTGRRSADNARKTAKRRIAKRESALADISAPVLRLAFADTVRDPAHTVDKLIAFCEITPTQAQRTAAAAFVDPALRHFPNPAPE